MKYTTILIALVLAIAPVLASAQNRTSSEDEREQLREEARAELQEKQQERQQELQKQREEKMGELENKRLENQQRLEERRTEMEKKILERKNEFEAKREEIQNRYEERKAEFEAKREEIKNRLNEERKNRIGEHQQNIKERLGEVVVKLENIVSRTAERIAEEKQAGVDTTVAESLLANAKDKIELAKNSIALIEAIDISTAENPGEAFADLEAQAQTAKEAIKVAHSALVDVIESLKAEREASDTESQNDSEATTTSE